MATPLLQGPLPDTSMPAAGTPPLPSGSVAPSSGGGGISLASLLGTGSGVGSTIAAQNARLANAQGQMAQDFSAIQSASQAIVDATAKKGADDVVISSQNAKGLLDAQEAARSVAASYGGNPDDVSFIMNKLASQWQDTEAQRMQALDVVTKKQSVNFFDDPLTWLSNKLTVNTDIAQYNDLEEKSNALYDQLEKINTLNTSTAQSMKAIARTQTAATVEATADLAAQNATIAAKNASIQGLLYNAKGLQDITNMGQQQVSNTVQGAQVAIAQGHLAVAQAQLAVSEKELSMKADLYAEETKQKQMQDETDAFVADQTNKGRAAMGLPPLPPAKIFAMFKLGGEVGESLKHQYTAGAMSAAIGKPIIASSTGTTARVLATANSPLATTNPAVKSVVDLLENSYQNARNPQNAVQLGINPKDVSTLDNAVSGIVQQRVAAMGQNIKPGDASNIFQAPPLSALATLKSVQQNPVFTKVLQPQIQAGMAETDPNKIISITVDAVHQGKISLNDAAVGISGLFQSAAALNTSTKDFTRFGIAPQATYNTMLNGTGVFGGSTKIDLTNKAQVTTAIMKMMNRAGAGEGSSLEGFLANF